MNLGAESITDTGLYYQWGDIQGYTAAQVNVDKIFNEDHYKYYSNYRYTKYNSTDNLTELLSEDDAVIAAWGGSWRMPTKEEAEILFDSVNMEYTADY